jgi:hypothetical protein
MERGLSSPMPETAAPPKVSPLARLIDLAGVLIFLLGAALYAYAWAGMRVLQDALTAPMAAPGTHFERYDWLWSLSRVGIVVAIVGISVILVASALSLRQRRTQQRLASTE